MIEVDLTIPENAYMFGFFQTDGHLQRQSKNKGKFTLELGKQDEHILYEFQKLIPCYSSVIPRNRDTNFKKDYDSCVLAVSDLSFRTVLNSLGIPYGKKSSILRPPTVDVSIIDYVRGLVDANGSVGYTEKKLPFISYTTYSDAMADYYKAFILNNTGRINRAKRNKRDNIYNINMMNEEAIVLSKILYPDNCLSLKRKYDAAHEIFNWERPAHWRVKIMRDPWTKDQDQFILNHPVLESIQSLKRSKSSIITRLWRLKCSK